MDTSHENSKPGRKPLLDDAKRREICAILAIGGTRGMAAHYVGCSVDTIGRTALRDPPFAAYAWDPSLTDDQLRERLLQLNLERAAADQ